MWFLVLVLREKNDRFRECYNVLVMKGHIHESAY